MSDATIVSQSSDRFVVEVDGRPAGLARFAERDGRRIFFHTEVGDEFEGQGLASTLVRQALDRTEPEGGDRFPPQDALGRLAEGLDREAVEGAGAAGE